MKKIFILITVLFLNAAIAKANSYIGKWEVEIEQFGCPSPIEFINGESKNTIKLISYGLDTNIHKEPQVVPQINTFVSEHKDYKLNSFIVGQIIDGTVVTTHLWSPQNSQWAGVGIKTWKINNDGRLILKKSGLTFQKTSEEKEVPTEQRVFQVDKGHNVIQWQVECTYKRSL